MNVGKYKILEKIGHGGMGEVFLAHDPICGRDVALKQMKEQWLGNKTMKERFLREARIAAQLSHPSIIPIYAISQEGHFYTMPRVEGDTLKAILQRTKEQAKTGDLEDPIGSSVPALIRIFLSVCGAMAYAHARGVIHRDLKPENVIVGTYGEVIIIDWGLADFIANPEKNGLHFKEGDPHLTQPGKIPGTLMFMAPERAFGTRSSIVTDIYSLGVMLYQILTLKFPFHRGSLKEFRKMHKHEEILNPEEAAPDRDISPHLSNITMRCLEKEPEKRFQSVSELIKELENYISGIPEWLEGGVLNLENKEDWRFQENVALTKHMALTRGVEMVEWVNLSVSKAHFPGNIQLETEVTLEKGSKGLGILLAMPDHNLHQGVEESYLLWLEPESVRLFRAGVEVISHEDIHLDFGKAYSIKIEMMENHLRFFLSDALKFAFLSHIPLPGSRIGLMTRDGHFHLSTLHVHVGSQNILVNCLAVPDAFSARGNFDEALSEYRKISQSFPGRAEGREATYRAGVTLLKKAERQRQKKVREALFSYALDEFEKLHNTPGAPLEYLGKALVYKAQKDLPEEAKCLELALRKYPKHPLKPILVETILSRLHETGHKERKQAFRFALIVLRHLAHLEDAKTIAELLEHYLEPLPFFIPSDNRNAYLTIQLAFWLNKPLVPYEMLEKGLTGVDEQNAHIALILLDCADLADLSILQRPSPQINWARFFHHKKTGAPLPDDALELPLQLWMALEAKNWEKAKEVLAQIDPEELQTEKSPLFFLYGCYLAGVEGEKAALTHLTNISESAFPPTSALLSHYLMGRITLKKGWIERAFDWERTLLKEELVLFFRCLGREKELRKIANMG